MSTAECAVNKVALNIVSYQQFKINFYLCIYTFNGTSLHTSADMEYFVNVGLNA